KRYCPVHPRVGHTIPRYEAPIPAAKITLDAEVRVVAARRIVRIRRSEDHVDSRPATDLRRGRQQDLAKVLERGMLVMVHLARPEDLHRTQIGLRRPARAGLSTRH